MLKFLFSFLFLFTFNLLIGQSKSKTAGFNGSVVGSIVEAKSDKALGGVTIQLKSITDKQQIQNLVADKHGAFEFSKLNPGYYSLHFTMLGFANTVIDSILLNEEKPDINLGDIKLNESASSLTEVIVYSSKPLFENKDGKLIVNVAESPLNNGVSASEMLRNLPLMNVNPDGS